MLFECLDLWVPLVFIQGELALSSIQGRVDSVFERMLGSSLGTSPNQGGDRFQYPAPKNGLGYSLSPIRSVPRNVWGQEINEMKYLRWLQHVRSLNYQSTAGLCAYQWYAPPYPPGARMGGRSGICRRIRAPYVGRGGAFSSYV